MAPTDLNIGESRVWQLDEKGQIYNPETSTTSVDGMSFLPKN